MTRFLLLVPLLAAVAAAAPPPAVPCPAPVCKCDHAGPTMRDSVAAWSARAEAVLLGTVVRVDTLSPAGHPTASAEPNLEIVARVRVERSWKGPASDTVTVQIGTTRRMSSCDLPLVAGRRYVVFAPGALGVLWTHYCSGTTPAEGADSLIAALGPSRTRTP